MRINIINMFSENNVKPILSSDLIKKRIFLHMLMEYKQSWHGFQTEWLSHENEQLGRSCHRNDHVGRLGSFLLHKSWNIK